MALRKKGVKTLEDFADLAGDELVEMLAGAVPMDESTAGDLILQARLVLGWIEPDDIEEGDEEPQDEAIVVDGGEPAETTH